MSSPESPRQHRGRTTPATNDGSYAPYPHEAPEVSLADHVEVPEGTYLYPPLCTNAAQMEAFWSHVEVPEAVLHRLRRLYAERAVALKSEWPDLYWGMHGETVYQADNPPPGPDASDAERLAWESARDQARASTPARVQELMAPVPTELSRFEVRDLARALGMVGALAYAEPAEHAAALRTYRVNCLGAERSLEETLARTGLSRLYPEVALPECYDLDASDEQARIAAVERKLDALTQQTSQSTQEIKATVTSGSDYVAGEVGKAGRLIIASQDPKALREYERQGLL